MSFVNALFSFKWRMNRLPFFLYNVLLLAVIYGISYLLTYFWLLDKFDAQFLISFIFIYPGLALMIKRFHDKDRSGKWIIPLYIGSMALAVITYYYVSVMPGYLFSILSLLYMASTIALIVVTIILLFVKWTKGKNKYGKDLLKTK